MIGNSIDNKNILRLFIIRYKIGRFQGLDKLSELTPSLTPNHFGFNNPLFYNDPTGLASMSSANATHLDGESGGKQWKSWNEMMNYYYGPNDNGSYGGSGGGGSSSVLDGWEEDGKGGYKYVANDNVGYSTVTYYDQAQQSYMYGDEGGNKAPVVLGNVPNVMVSATARSRSIWQRITDIVYQINKFNPIANIANGFWIGFTGHDSYGVKGNGWDAANNFIYAGMPFIGKVGSLVAGGANTIYRVVAVGETADILSNGFRQAPISSGISSYEGKLFWTNLEDAKWYQNWLGEGNQIMKIGVNRNFIFENGSDVGRTFFYVSPERLKLFNSSIKSIK